MNLLCPHCQQMLTVPEQNAGQAMKCPLCNQTFTVPALPSGPAPGPVLKDVPADIPLAPLPPEPEAKPSPRPTPQLAHEEPVYKLATEPLRPAPPPLPPRREERVTASPPRPTPPPQPTPAPPPLPAGYQHTSTCQVNPQVVAWIAPAALFVVLVLWFVPSWVEASPGGYAVYTQRGFQTLWGGMSADAVGQKVLGEMKPSREINRDSVPSNWLTTLLFICFLVAALALAVVPLVSAQAPALRQHPFVQQVWPWRSVLLVVASLLALVFMLLQLGVGFGLQKAVAAQAAAGAPQATGKETPDEEKAAAIRQGLEVDQYHLRHTFWFWLALALLLVALLAAALELWLERRAGRPLPRMELHW
jgi:hypothetical protein